MKLDDPRAWIHAQHCACDDCTPYHPAVLPALTWVDLARLAFLGLAGGLTVAALFAPLRVTAAIAALVGLG